MKYVGRIGNTSDIRVSGRNKDKDRAMTMSKVYGSSVNYLNALVVKAERILLYIQICRKYETQDEKILPPGVDRVTFDVQPPVARNDEEDGSSLDLVIVNLRNRILLFSYHRSLPFQLLTTPFFVSIPFRLQKITNI